MNRLPPATPSQQQPDPVLDPRASTTATTSWSSVPPAEKTRSGRKWLLIGGAAATILLALLLMNYFFLLPALPTPNDCRPFRFDRYRHMYTLQNHSAGSPQHRQQLVATMLEEYREFHACSTSGWRGEAAANVVVFDAVDGLANRMRGLMSTFLYALVTGRVFHVNWIKQEGCQAELDDLVTAPFGWQSNTITWRGSLYRVWTLLFNHHLVRDFSFQINKRLLCIDFDTDPRRVVWWRTNQYLVPHLNSNPTYAQALDDVFSHEYFALVFPHLLRPSAAVATLLDNHLRTVLLLPPPPSPAAQAAQPRSRSQLYMVGLHVRLPGYVLGLPVLEQFVTAAAQIIHTLRIPAGKQLVVVMAADSLGMTEAALVWLRDALAPLHPLLYHDGNTVDRESKEGVQRAYALLLLLQQCDEVIVSGSTSLAVTSSFGLLAQSQLNRGFYLVDLQEPVQYYHVDSSEPDRDEKRPANAIAPVCAAAGT